MMENIHPRRYFMYNIETLIRNSNITQKTDVCLLWAGCGLLRPTWRRMISWVVSCPLPPGWWTTLSRRGSWDPSMPHSSGVSLASALFSWIAELQTVCPTTPRPRRLYYFHVVCVWAHVRPLPSPASETWSIYVSNLARVHKLFHIPQPTGTDILMFLYSFNQSVYPTIRGS